MIKIFIFLLSFMFATTEVYAIDWSDCANDLDRLRRAARDAADYAETANSRKEELESKKDELEDCLRYPSTYDYYGDKCQSRRWDYESALRDYESAVSSVESEIDTVNSRIKSVISSCDNDYVSQPFKPNSSQPIDPACKVYLKYKGKIPDQKLLEICKKNMTEAACKKGLDVK